MDLIVQLGKAVSAGDFDNECILVGELKAVSLKKFEALPKVLEILLNVNKDDE